MRLPPISPRPDTLLPYTTLLRSSPRVHEGLPHVGDVVEEQLEELLARSREEPLLCGGDARLRLLDQLGDDRWVGVDRLRRRPRGTRPGSGRPRGRRLVGAQRADCVALDARRQRIADPRLGTPPPLHTTPADRGPGD